jgi:hypothetical protein
MRNLAFVFILTFTLTGCAVFDKYYDNTDTWYHASLSKSEKDSIFITKKWYGRNSNGDFSKGELLIKDTPVKNCYEFIPTGTWTEKHTASASKGWEAIIKDSTVYDMMGNILFKEKYMDELGDNKGQYLYEKWTSTLSDSLRQTVILYYPNGQIKSKENFTTINYKYLVSDSKKEKWLTGFEAYQQNGQKCSMEDLSYDQWYEPATRMKK